MQPGEQRLLSFGPLHDGRVNLIGGIVGEFEQEQQLRERVVLAGEAFGQPVPGVFSRIPSSDDAIEALGRLFCRELKFYEDVGKTRRQFQESGSDGL